MDKKIKLQREWFRTMQAEGIRDPRLLGRIWECVDGKGFVNQAFNDPAEQPLQILLRDTAPFVEGAKIQAELSRSLSKADEQGDQVGQGHDDDRAEIRFRLKDLERERALVFEKHLARIAAADYRVHRYRERVLEEKLLTLEEAHAFLNSPAAGVFSRRQFDSWKVPLVKHTAELIEANEVRTGGRVGWRLTVQVEPPGMERTIPRRLQELSFIGEDGSAESIAVGEGSVLGELAELVDKLSAKYPWGSKAEIANFVLTGAVPEVPPVRMYYSRRRKLNLEYSPGGFRHGTITLEVAPWLSAKTVEAAYRYAKKQVLGKRKYRRLEGKSLKMIDFVEGYEKPPKGRQLLEIWNNTEWVNENPTWSYDPDTPGESSRFWRDYRRARRTLAYEKRPARGAN